MKATGLKLLACWSFVVCTIIIGIWSCSSAEKKSNVAQNESEEVLPAIKGEYYCIILGGGKTAQDAQKVADSFKKYKYPLAFSKKYPMMLKSDTIEGLNAGFQISVLGLCKNEESAALIRDIINAISETQAYCKKVVFKFRNNDEPTINFTGEATKKTPEFTQFVSKNASSVEWKLYKSTNELENGKKVDSYILAVVQNGKILASKEFKGIHIEGDGDGNLGESSKDEFGVVQLGARSLILKKNTYYTNDEGNITHTLYAYQGNEIKNVATIFKGTEFYGPPLSCKVMEEESGGNWKKLVVLLLESYNPIAKDYYDWNTDELTYKHVNTEDLTTKQ